MSDFKRTSPHESKVKPETAFPLHKTHFHPPRKPEPDPVPTFFWPVMMFLLSVSVSLICWGAYTSLPQMTIGGEKHLRQGHLSSKFNPNSAEVPVVEGPELLPEPEMDELTVIANATGEPPLLPPSTFEIALPRPMNIEPPPSLPSLPPPPPVAIEPAQLVVAEPFAMQVQNVASTPLVYRESTSGDTPMLRTWKTLALYSLLSTAVIVQIPAPAVADEKTVMDGFESLKKTINESFDTVKKDMADLKKEVGLQKKTSDKQGLDLTEVEGNIKSINAALDQMRKDLDALMKREPVVDNKGMDKAGLADIKTLLASIEQAILKLQQPTNRVAYSPTPATTTGRVVLVNLYPEELLFVVNQKTHRVAPGANLPLDTIPAGPLSYEVISGTWGLRARNTTTLAPNETFTLTAR